jgi:hypothetical protein
MPAAFLQSKAKRIQPASGLFRAHSLRGIAQPALDCFYRGIMPSSYGEQMGMKGRLRPMKNPFRLLTAVLLLATASQAWAVDQYLKTSITGAIQTQLLLGPGVGRIYTAPLNKKRIFQEFGVLPQIQSRNPRQFRAEAVSAIA